MEGGVVNSEMILLSLSQTNMQRKSLADVKSIHEQQSICRTHKNRVEKKATYKQESNVFECPLPPASLLLQFPVPFPQCPSGTNHAQTQSMVSYS
jgi:hypothetical protein